MNFFILKHLFIQLVPLHLMKETNEALEFPPPLPAAAAGRQEQILVKKKFLNGGVESSLVLLDFRTFGLRIAPSLPTRARRFLFFRRPILRCAGIFLSVSESRQSLRHRCLNSFATMALSNCLSWLSVGQDNRHSG